MRAKGSSEHHRNNVLKTVIAYANFLGSETTFLEAALSKFNRRHPRNSPTDTKTFVDELAKRNIEAWIEVKNVIVDRKDELTKAILREKIPLFHY